MALLVRTEPLNCPIFDTSIALPLICTLLLCSSITHCKCQLHSSTLIRQIKFLAITNLSETNRAQTQKALIKCLNFSIFCNKIVNYHFTKSINISRLISMAKHSLGSYRIPTYRTRPNNNKNNKSKKLFIYNLCYNQILQTFTKH